MSQNRMEEKVELSECPLGKRMSALHAVFPCWRSGLLTDEDGVTQDDKISPAAKSFEAMLLGDRQQLFARDGQEHRESAPSAPSIPDGRQISVATRRLSSAEVAHHRGEAGLQP